MRSPNHLEIKARCRESIPLLMEKYNLGTPRKIIMDQVGWVNPCFFADDNWVFRFNARDPHLPKYQREKLIFDLLGSSAVPVPQKVLLDDSHEVSEYDVLISQRIPGRNLESVWSRLDVDLRTQLAHQAGTLMAQINNFEFPFFGELTGLGPFPQTKDWTSYLEFKLQYHLQEAAPLKIFAASVEEKIWQIFKRLSDFLKTVTQAQLVPVDYHFGNLIFNADQICGVLDFEWALAGDPLYDCCRWSHGHEDWAGSRHGFLKGYQHPIFTSEEISRINLYQMIRNIELCVVSRLYFDAEEAQSFFETTLAHIKRI